MAALPLPEKTNISVTTNRASGPARDVKQREHTAAAEKPREFDFDRVFLEQYARVYAIVVRIVGDRAEAEDLALETFWQLHRRPPAADRDTASSPYGAWLYRVATNLGLNALRARKRRERYELEAGQEADTQRGGDPAGEAAAEEERERVRQVLGQMDARQAQLLLLRHSGMSYGDLAAALNLSPNSIGTLLARAQREFERRYKGAT